MYIKWIVYYTRSIVHVENYNMLTRIDVLHHFGARRRSVSHGKMDEDSEAGTVIVLIQTCRGV